MSRTSVLLLFLCTLLLTGCTATMVVKPGMSTHSKYAPVNESSRGGIVKYLNQGAASVVAKRRENAYRQMYEACGGAYRIVAEGPKAEGGVVVPAGNMLMFASQQYIYIQFECAEPEDPSPGITNSIGSSLDGTRP